MFWRFPEKSYLCIRFQGATLPKHKRKSSLKRLHKTEKVVQVSVVQTFLEPVSGERNLHEMTSWRAAFGSVLSARIIREKSVSHR